MLSKKMFHIWINTYFVGLSDSEDPLFDSEKNDLDCRCPMDRVRYSKNEINVENAPYDNITTDCTCLKPSEYDFILTLPKSEIDKANKDKNISDDFRLSLFISKTPARPPAPSYRESSNLRNSNYNQLNDQ